MNYRGLSVTRSLLLNANNRPPPVTLTPPSGLWMTPQRRVGPQTKLFQELLPPSKIVVFRHPRALCPHLHPALLPEAGRGGDIEGDPLVRTPALLPPHHRPPPPPPALHLPLQKDKSNYSLMCSDLYVMYTVRLCSSSLCISPNIFICHSRRRRHKRSESSSCSSSSRSVSRSPPRRYRLSYSRMSKCSRSRSRSWSQSRSPSRSPSQRVYRRKLRDVYRLVNADN